MVTKATGWWSREGGRLGAFARPLVAAGVLLVMGPGEAVRAQAAAPPRLQAKVQTVYEVGGGPATGGDAPYELGRVTDVAFGPDGALWVLDGLGFRVTHVDADGRPTGTFGRAGDGPGEFRRPVDLTAPAPGMVAVLDSRRGRVTMFDVSGRLLHDWPAPQELGDGTIAHLGSETLVLVGGASRWQQPDSITIWTLRVGQDEGFVARLRVANPRHTTEMSDPQERPDGGMRFQRRSLAPFLPAVRVAGGRRLVLAPGFTYRLLALDAAGDLEEVRRSEEPRRVDEALRQRARDQLRRFMLERAQEQVGSSGGFTGVTMSPSEIDAWAESMLFPDRVPVVRDVMGSAEGDLWVRVSGADPLEPRRLDVYGADLTIRGTLDDLEFPRALGPGGLAAWVERDEYDVESVRVARVELSPAG